MGDAGSLTLETGRLILDDGAFVSTQVRGQGNGANLSIVAFESIELRGRDGQRPGSAIQASVRTSGRGNAGNLEIETGRLLLQDEAQIAAETEGQGNAGNLTIRATDSIEVIDGSTITAATAGNGNAGNLTLSTGDFIVRDGGEVIVSGAGDFPAGTLTIDADLMRLDSDSRLFAETESGDLGNIFLTTESLQLRRRSAISTNASGFSTGGNIAIDTDTLVALENSDITANASNAAGGRVNVTATGIFGTEFRAFQTPQSDITATSALGAEFSGTVEINTPDIDSTSGLFDLETETIDATALNFDDCREYAGSGFYYTGRGGIPENPRQFLEMQIPLEDLGELEPLPEYREKEDNSLPTTEYPFLREATSWSIAPDGQISLVSQSVNKCHFTPSELSIGCRSIVTISFVTNGLRTLGSAIALLRYKDCFSGLAINYDRHSSKRE